MEEYINKCESFTKHYELLMFANQEADIAELRHIRANAKNYVCEQYWKFTRGMAFFFYSGMKPASVADADFMKFKPLMERLVAAGVYKEKVLEAFN